MTFRSKLEATHLRDNRYAVRPAGQLGTCGFTPYPWTVVYVNARNEQQACMKACSAPGGVFEQLRKARAAGLINSGE